MNDANHPANPYYSRTDTTPLNLSDLEWKKVLPDSIYQVARNKKTEMAFTGKFWDFEEVKDIYDMQKVYSDDYAVRRDRIQERKRLIREILRNVSDFDGYTGK